MKNAELTGTQLFVARATYAALAVLTVATFVHALPLWLENAFNATTALGAVVVIDALTGLLVPVAGALIASLILWRRSRDRYGLFSSFEGLAVGSIIGVYTLVPLDDPWSLITRVARDLTVVAILAQIVVFPNGRFAPRWSAGLVVVFGAWLAISLFVTNIDYAVVRGVWQLAFASGFLVGLAVMGYRYARVLTTVERTQMKWVLVGVAGGVAAYAVWSFVRFVIGPGVLAVAADALTNIATVVSIVLFGIAIVRYRLFDVDLLVNRTVLYGSVALFLVAAFAALSAAARTLIGAVAGTPSEVVTVPLVVVAALSFGPLQRRIRPIVDRLLPPRVPLAVFFTDVVDSTARAVDIGDERWREALVGYRTTVRQGLRRFRGSEVDTAGDGFFAVFERPRDAWHAAEYIRDAVRRIGLDSRFGLHLGECEMRGEKVSGVAVIAGARVMNTAHRNEIVVSAAMRDALGADAGALADRGDQTLKGLPGAWRLYALQDPAPGDALGARPLV